MDDRSAVEWLRSLAVAIGMPDDRISIEYETPPHSKESPRWQVSISYHHGVGETMSEACSRLHELVTRCYAGGVSEARARLAGAESLARGLEAIKRPA